LILIQMQYYGAPEAPSRSQKHAGLTTSLGVVGMTGQDIESAILPSSPSSLRGTDVSPLCSIMQGFHMEITIVASSNTNPSQWFFARVMPEENEKGSLSCKSRWRAIPRSPLGVSWSRSQKSIGRGPSRGGGTSTRAFLHPWTPYDLKHHLVLRVSLKAQPFTQDCLCEDEDALCLSEKDSNSLKSHIDGESESGSITY
jgi:hypothetical protein